MRLGIASGAPPVLAAVRRVLARAGLEVELPSPGAGLATADAHQVLLAPAADVLTLCAAGVLDAAVVGREWLLELRPPVSELVDLRVGPGRLVYATAGEATTRRPRLATRFPRLARLHLGRQGMDADIVTVESEVLPLIALGAADAAVLVIDDEADDLAPFGLDCRAELERCSRRLVVPRAAQALRGAAVAALCARLADIPEA